MSRDMEACHQIRKQPPKIQKTIVKLIDRYYKKLLNLTNMMTDAIFDVKHCRHNDNVLKKVKR